MTPTKIKSLRKRLGLSQEAFAELVGVSTSSLGSWERNSFKPSSIFVKEMENILEISEKEMNEIKALRKRLGLSQEALAHLIGVSFQTVNRWERGHSKPSSLSMQRLKTLEQEHKLEKTHETM